MRVYTDERYVLYKAHISKDTKGMNDDGILQNLPDSCTVMHDHLLHNYCDDYQYNNIECNAHVTKKLEGITQNISHKWSDDMKKLLEEMLSKRKEYISKRLNSFEPKILEEFSNKYEEIIENGFKEYVEFRYKYEFEREENLLEFMRDFKGAITAWIYDFSLPYCNNLSESLLRMLKSKMKISYRFRDITDAEYFANIRTYTETCNRFGLNIYEAICRLFNGNLYAVEDLEKIKDNK